MKRAATFNINGMSHELIIAADMTLYEVLRKLHLTGTKRSCGVGECGSCTVLVGGTPMLACSTLAITIEGKEIVTIEGLATGGRLHVLQEAFVDAGAIQCGFCTPGMIMMAKALLDENPNPSRAEVKEGLGGNICRCTGYVKIVDAVMAAAEKMRDGAS